MKKLIFAFFALTILDLTYSQSCIDFANYTTAYVDSVTNDNINFPAGTTFISEGDLELKKMSNSFYQGVQGDSALFYVGDILIDVSGSACSNKILTFKSTYTEEIIVDGDTISQFATPPSFYQGNGFTFQFSGQGLGSGSFTISGDFDTVYLLTSTNFLWDICLNCQTSAPSCLDFSLYTTAYVDSVTQDDINFPDGSPFIAQGGLEFIKTTNGVYQGVQGDTALLFLGELELNLSNYNCVNKKLTFSTAYTEGVVVDGDTAYHLVTTPSFYQGNGYTIDFVGTGFGNGTFTITGDFDEVVLLTQTNFIWDVCVECINSMSSCLDFGQYDNAYVDSVTQDNVNFPPGTAFMTQGDIQIVKIDNMSFFQGISGDTALFYIGNLAIDVSTMNCSNKRLTFKSSYTEQVIVDGDTVSQFTTPPSFYQGNGFTFEFSGSGMGSGEFTITGDFDVVTLLTQTNFLWDVCLECLATASIEQEESITTLELLLYPNPTSGLINVNFPEKENYEIHVLDAQGRLFNTQQVNGENHQLDLSSSPNGIYFIHVLSKKGWQMTKKVVKN